MLQNIIKYQSFENTQGNFYGEVYSSKVPQRRDCNFAISRLHPGFFSEYVPKVASKSSCLEKNIIEKRLSRTSVLIKLCKLDLTKEALKMPMYLQKNLPPRSFLSVLLLLLSLFLQFSLKQTSLQRFSRIGFAQ